MNGGDILFDALNGVSDRYVLEAGDLLRIGEEKPHGRGKAKLWKTALLAAALALLLAAAAYAAGLLHWKDQTYSIEGTNRVIVVPNGLRGTKNIRRHRRMVDVGRGTAEDLDGTRLELHARGRRSAQNLRDIPGDDAGGRGKAAGDRGDLRS